MSNQTSTTEFLLLEFSDVRELQIVHFVVFLAVYLATVTGNLLIISVVAFDQHLHTPMYFFLMNLAMTDIGSISVTIPKSMVNSLMNTRLISYSGCAAQVYFFLLFAASDYTLLTVMAHDRYVAICNPLRYETIMNKGACIQMAASAWLSSLFYAVLHTGTTFTMTFCSNNVDQFFCEVPQLVKISCSDLYLVENTLLALSVTVAFGCFIFVVITYVQIFSTVLRIPSSQGRQKAFSTCLPHLIVFSMFLFGGMLVYLRPIPHPSSQTNLAFAVIYSVVPPMMNPVIYSMRNKDIKLAMCKLLHLK
ncbi:olfactory receptor 14I1-like [Eublepharis macularius]|uniref:Olfactory receptor 14I1-like n=1 Tax=Eublepharis macularius TaxID=481883 RepID=A0AA97LE56_EUBMA|nr:olfactory receptor 14I1-like [Eublepharis macularius]